MNARSISLVLIMAVLLATGLSTGGRLYYLIGILLLLMLAFSFASCLWALLSVQVGVKRVEGRVTRGEALPLLFSVRHRCPMPIAGIRLEMELPSAVCCNREIMVRALPFRTHNFRQLLRCPHRGVYQVGISAVSVRDVFGLFTFSRKLHSKAAALEVAPKERDARSLELGAVDVGPEFISKASEDNASPSDVRAWQEGDSLKKVHWKLSMRRREMMVRTYEESARPDTLVIPDLTPIPALRDQQLTMEDEICEACLAAVKAQLKAGYPVRMPLTSAQPAEISGQFPSDLGAFTDALMRGAFDSAYPYEQVLYLMNGRLQRTGGAVLVTARLTTRTADMAMKMHRAGVRVKLIWVSEDVRDETLELLERLKMEGLRAERVDPWSKTGAKMAQEASDAYDAYDEQFSRKDLNEA